MDGHIMQEPEKKEEEYKHQGLVWVVIALLIATVCVVHQTNLSEISYWLLPKRLGISDIAVKYLCNTIESQYPSDHALNLWGEYNKL